MVREGAPDLDRGTNLYRHQRLLRAATLDPTNGFAYFGSRCAYKVDISGALPVQVGPGVNFGGGQAFSAVMDPSAGCAYFGVSTKIVQILANGTNAPTLGAVMLPPLPGSTFISQLLIDTSDPANHYLYAMTTTGTTLSSTPLQNRAQQFSQ